MKKQLEILQNWLEINADAPEAVKLAVRKEIKLLTRQLPQEPKQRVEVAVPSEMQKMSKKELLKLYADMTGGGTLRTNLTKPDIIAEIKMLQRAKDRGKAFAEWGK